VSPAAGSPGVIAVNTPSEGRVEVPVRTVGAIEATSHCAGARP
jgi:hypothetical protein